MREASSRRRTSGEDDDGTTRRRTSRACGVRIRGGRYCNLTAGLKTDHEGVGPCYKHGGNSVNGLKQTGVRLAHLSIMDPDISPGDIVQLEPHNALIWSVWLSGGDAAYWNQQLAEANLELMDAQDSGDEKKIEKARKHLKECFAQQRTAVREMRSAGKMALDAGLAERQVQMAERMGGMIAKVIGDVTADLDLNERQERRLPALIQTALMNLEAPGAPTKSPRPKLALINHDKDDIIDVSG